MMRKGDLRQYPIEWVLRAAAEERLSGGIEFHAGPTVCVHLAGGGIYLALSSGEAVPEDEAGARRHSVAAIAGLLDERDGWYYFHPVEHHPLRGAWRWEVEDILAAARPEPVPTASPSRADEAFVAAASVAAAVRGAVATTADAPARPAAAPVRPTAAPVRALPVGPHVPSRPIGRPAPAMATARISLATGTPPGRLSDEAWAIVSAMTAPIGPGELAVRLGWDRRRLDEALAGLAAAGVVSVPPRPGVALVSPLIAEPAAADEPTAPPVTARRMPEPEGTDGPGDGAEGAGDDGSRQNALRRLIRSLRAAS